MFEKTLLNCNFNEEYNDENCGKELSQKLYKICDNNYSSLKKCPEKDILLGTKDMKESAMKQIKNRINQLPYGNAFVVSDFTDITDYENAKKCLLRLEKESVIRRVFRGIYDKPRYSDLIKEVSAPNFYEVVKAIARNYSWDIAPSGIAALNILGLSTQVPYTFEYYSTGKYKTYSYGKIRISFRHRSSKELSNLSYKSSLVVQAIKEVGTGINDDTIDTISHSLSRKEKEILLKETSGVTKWIYEIVKKIYHRENPVCTNS